MKYNTLEEFIKEYNPHEITLYYRNKIIVKEIDTIDFINSDLFNQYNWFKVYDYDISIEKFAHVVIK